MLSPITHEVITQAIAWGPMPKPLVHQRYFHIDDRGNQEALYELSFLTVAVEAQRKKFTPGFLYTAESYLKNCLAQSFCGDIDVISTYQRGDSVLIAEICYSSNLGNAFELPNLDWPVD
jgi:hypothetical protein